MMGLTELPMSHGAKTAAWCSSIGVPCRRPEKIEQGCAEQADEVAWQIWELECSLKKSEGRKRG